MSVFYVSKWDTTQRDPTIFAGERPQLDQYFTSAEEAWDFLRDQNAGDYEWYCARIDRENAYAASQYEQDIIRWKVLSKAGIKEKKPVRKKQLVKKTLDEWLKNRIDGPTRIGWGVKELKPRVRTVEAS